MKVARRFLETLQRCGPVRRSVRQELAMLFALAAAIRFVWACIIPPWVGPDEASHFTYVAHIVENEELPHFGPYSKDYPNHSLEVTRSCWQTFCDRISALAAPRVRELNYFPVSHDYRVAREYLESDPEARKSRAGSTATDYPPFYYLFATLFYRVFSAAPVLSRLVALRVATALLSALTAVFAYLMVFEARRDRSLASIVGTMVALTPMSSFVGGCVNNDAAMLAATGALCWLTARYSKSEVMSIGQGAWLGGVAGLVFLTKPTGAPVVLLALAYFFLRAVFAPRGASLRERCAGLTAFVLVLCALEGGWHWSRSLTSPTGTGGAPELGVFGVLLGRAPYSFRTYLNDLFVARGDWYFWWLFKSFWALFGWQEIALRERIYAVILVASLIGICGFIYSAARGRFSAIELWIAVAIIGHVAGLFLARDYLLSFATSGA
ncbi:MAG TPA: DUF2142 domain-containing protein, partial [Polyangiaceae bacterium]|nr:DUF2142 domain-containing protein [Polyangiaceae bacterium]